MPNVEDITAHFLSSDVVWVCGGSIAACLRCGDCTRWTSRMAAAWQAGVVPTGVSAGSICWHVGERPIYGPSLRPVTDGLGLVPYSNGVRYIWDLNEGHCFIG